MYSKYEKLRDARGMNNLQVAEAVGIPQSTLYDWQQRDAEKKGAGMKVENLAKIARFFGVTVDYFIDEDKGKGND